MEGLYDIHNIRYYTNSLPDFTVGSGISPDQLKKARGLYHRYGISPIPVSFIFYFLLLL